MLSVRDLEVAYGAAQVLFGINLEVAEGSLTCVMGRNGVGKSTLLKAVLGVLALQSGQISFDGHRLDKARPFQRARLGIGYVPQGQIAFPRLTTRENLAVAREAERGRHAQAVDDALDLFPRLRPLLDRPAGVLSGGQRQQLAIARALVGRPRLLLLDEPTEGIQPSIVDEISDAIAALHRDGLTVLLVEQHLDFAVELADHVAVIDAGRIVRDGPAGEMDSVELGRLIGV